MKKLVALITVLASSFYAYSQDVVAQKTYTISEDAGLMHKAHVSLTVICILLIALSFIIIMTKTHYEYRLKKNLIDRSVPENIVIQFLKPNPKEDSREAIKWVSILLGAGIGLAVVSFINHSLGIHSLAIMIISVALGYLAYYYFTKKKQE